MSGPTSSFHANTLSNLDLVYFTHREIDLSLGLFEDGSDPYGASTVDMMSYSKYFRK